LIASDTWRKKTRKSQTEGTARRPKLPQKAKKTVVGKRPVKSAATAERIQNKILKSRPEKGKNPYKIGHSDRGKGEDLLGSQGRMHPRGGKRKGHKQNEYSDWTLHRRGKRKDHTAGIKIGGANQNTDFPIKGKKKGWQGPQDERKLL